MKNMRQFIYILIAIVLVISCDENPTQSDKDRIQKLEEKNKALEDELQKLKSKYEPNAKIKKDYFTIGSTENEVIEVMGQPTAYMITATEAKKFIYGVSTVYFHKGKVISYDNLDDNLKVKVK
jgi:peptidoglycan hydrolase CwlO-like protein